MQEYIYVLDYSDNTINEIKIEEEDLSKCVESIFDMYGIKPSNCSWMFSNKELNIQPLVKIDKQ